MAKITCPPQLPVVTETERKAPRNRRRTGNGSDWQAQSDIYNRPAHLGLAAFDRRACQRPSGGEGAGLCQAARCDVLALAFTEQKGEAHSPRPGIAPSAHSGSRSRRAGVRGGRAPGLCECDGRLVEGLLLKAPQKAA